MLSERSVITLATDAVAPAVPSLSPVAAANYTTVSGAMHAHVLTLPGATMEREPNRPPRNAEREGREGPRDRASEQRPAAQADGDWDSGLSAAGDELASDDDLAEPDRLSGDGPVNEPDDTDDDLGAKMP